MKNPRRNKAEDSGLYTTAHAIYRGVRSPTITAIAAEFFPGHQESQGKVFVQAKAGNGRL
jgi:hypothetical protein